MSGEATPVDAASLMRVAVGAIRGCPHARALNLRVEAVEPAHATLRLPYDTRLVGDPATGVIAGGAVTTLLDHVCGQGVWAALQTFTPVATLDLRIDYLRAAEPGLDIWASAHGYKLTRHVGFVRAVAWDRDREDPVATAQAAFALNRPPSASRRAQAAS